MATYTTQSNKERINYARLGMAVLDIGTEMLRECLSHNIKPVDIKNRVLGCTNLHLMPAFVVKINNAHTQGYSKFDISLLYILIRNLCPGISPTRGWIPNLIPAVNEVTEGDDVERIHIIRNNIYGCSPDTRKSDTEYSRYMAVLKGVFLRHDTRYKTSHTNQLLYIANQWMEDVTEDLNVSVKKQSSESHHGSESQHKTRRSIRNFNWDLYHEAGEGNHDNVEELLTNGANVNYQDGESKSSPLHIACKNVHTSVVKCLLRHNADVNLKDENGHTPLHVTVNNQIDKPVIDNSVSGNTREPHAKDIVKLLIDNKADINAKDKLGRTPLHLCIKYPVITEVLLNAGADCNLLDSKLQNPLHYAVDGHVAEILCRAKTDVNLQDMNGRTPLHEASWYNRHEVVRVLLNAGSKFDIKDKIGNISLEIAIARGSTEVAELLDKWNKTQDLSRSQEDDGKIPQEILQMDQISIDIYKKALMEGKEHDYTIRLEVVGQQGVGKTSLINRLLKLGLNCKEIESTNGIDIHVHRSAVNVHNGKWIFNEDEVKKLTNHESRLAEIVKKYKNEMEDFGMEENMVLEKNSGMEDETVIKSSFFEEEHGDSIEVSTENTEGVVSFTREETTPGVKEDDDDRKINEEYLKVKEAMKIRNSNEIFGQIYVWDFGGDFIFYTTHQTFLSPRAIYLVVFDITKELFEELKDKSNDNKCYFDISGVTYLRMGEYIVFWLNSIHTYASGDKDGVPPVILVATHLDKWKGDKESEMEQLFDKIREYLMENGMSLYDHLDDEDFGVDNTELADDSVFEELRQKIVKVAEAQKYWGEEKPAKWITFENLLLEKKNNGIRLLSFEEVMELNKGMESRKLDQDQLNVFLKFQHAIGNLIYFNDLNEYVVLDPKWLIDAFRCLITHEKFHKYTPFSIRSKWNKFTKTAELEMKLIDALWKDIEERHRKHLLGLMDKLDIIAKPRIYKETEDSNSGEELDYYFVPLMLKEKITDDQMRWIKKNACPTPNMYFVFQNQFLSPSVFHRLIAACMKKWDIACQGSKKLLFCGCGIFNMDQSQTTRIMVSMENYKIKVCVLYYHSESDTIFPDDVSKSVAIRTFVEETLKIIFGRYQQNVSHKLHIECRPGGGGLISVENLKTFLRINCSSHEEGHIVLSRQLLKYWFHPEEYQNMVDTVEEKHLIDLPYGYDDHRPSDKQLSDIATKIGSEYFRLAIELGLSNTEIQAIKHDFPNDCFQQCFQILQKWMRNRGKKTFGILHKAMCEVECDVQVLNSACMKEFVSYD